MRGLIGIPCAGEIPMEFFKCFLALDIPDGVEVSIISKTTIHVARETLVLEMKKGGYDWVLMLDDDMTFPKDLIQRLVSHNAPVVSAMCFKRTPPYTPCFYEKLEITSTGIKLTPYDIDERPEKPFAVEAAGAACMLIRKEVFDKIKYPWFLPLPFAGEDICFCKNLKESGIPILIDPSIEVGHLETRAVGAYEYLEAKSRIEGAV